MDIRFFDHLESTNNYCKLLDPDSVEEFTVICARRQSAGIGQRGNRWESEDYKNLTFSLILKPTFLATGDQYRLTMMLAVAITDSLAAMMPTADVRIKWPNDIYIGDKKICGTLVSNNIASGHISLSICGIGLNVNQSVFPDWVPNPTSMALETEQSFELESVLDGILESIRQRYLQLKESPDSIKPQYMSRLYRLNEKARYEYKGKTVEATITDVDHFGHLHLTCGDGDEITCDLKEIKFL